MEVYDLLVRNSQKIIAGLAKDPKSVSVALHVKGFISDSTLEEITELPATSKDKARKVYSALLSVMRNYPERFPDFLMILEENETLYGDLLNQIDGRKKRKG